jgi:hypothetical protein
MKGINIFPLFLVFSSILNNELLRSISFESFFPSSPEEKLHSIDNFNQWFAEVNHANTLHVAQVKYVF